MIRTTYTNVVLEVSSETYREIMTKLLIAEYDHVFIEDSNYSSALIDMTHISLAEAPRDNNGSK